MRQTIHLAGGITVELGEHEVPDFQVTVAVLILAPRRSALNRRTAVKEDLGADSLDLFEMVMALEEEFEVEIPTCLLYTSDAADEL